MCDHRADTNRNRDPMHAELSTPAVQLVSNCGVDERKGERPEPHFRLFDSAVATSQMYDYVVTEHARRPTDDVADQCREEDETGGRGGPVVRRPGKNFAYGVERNYTRSTTERKEEPSYHDVREGEQDERAKHVFEVLRFVIGKVGPRLQLLKVGSLREIEDRGPIKVIRFASLDVLYIERLRVRLCACCGIPCLFNRRPSSEDGEQVTWEEGLVEREKQ